MSYKGEPIGRVGGGVRVLRLTTEELEASQDFVSRTLGLGPTMRYCLEGHSHWNPPDFFRRYASELREKADLFEAAADLIEPDESRRRDHDRT